MLFSDGLSLTCLHSCFLLIWLLWLDKESIIGRFCRDNLGFSLALILFVALLINMWVLDRVYGARGSGV